MANNQQFFGWRLVGLAIISQAFQAGLLIYCFGIFALAFESQFDASREQIMWCASLLSVSTNILSPFMGFRIDKQSVRSLMFVGAACMALGMLVLGTASNIMFAWLVFALVLPFCHLLLGHMPTSALITRWFVVHRGKAMGIAAVGTSIGALIFPNLLTYLLENHGYFAAFATIALLAVVVLNPAIWKLAIDRPSDVDQFPDGNSAVQDQSATTNDSIEYSVKQILTAPRFWLVTAVTGLVLSCYIALLNNLVLHATDKGMSTALAASLISTIALVGIGGKIVFGFIADKVDLRIALLIAIILMCVGIGVLMIAEVYSTFLVAGVMLGLAAGSMLPVWSAMVAKCFGMKSFGRAFGLMNPAMTPFTAFTSPFAGWVFDTTGSYQMAFIGFIAILALAAILMAFIRWDR